MSKCHYCGSETQRPSGYCSEACIAATDARRRERLEIATAAMQAYVIANYLRPNRDITDLWTSEYMASWALADADALLAEAEKEQKA